MINDSNQKNSIDKDIEKDGLKVEGNILQVLSDIQEVTEEFSSTLLVRDDGSSESTIGRYQGFFKLVTRQMFDVLRYLYINYFSVHITGSDKVSCIHVASNREESFDDEQNNVNNVSKALMEDPKNNLHPELLKQDSKNKIKISNTAEKVEQNEIEIIGNSMQDENQRLSHSTTNIGTFESKMVQAESDVNIEFGREDTTYLASTMITAGIDNEGDQSFPKIKDLCTLIPLKAFEKLNKDLEASKTSKRKKKISYK